MSKNFNSRYIYQAYAFQKYGNSQNKYINTIN